MDVSNLTQFFTTFSLLVVVAWFKISSSTLESHVFSLVENPTKGSTRLGPSSVVTSRIECVTNCRKTYRGDCQTYMYNSETKLCTPGAAIDNNESAPSPAEGKLYKRVACDPAYGFSEVTYGGTTACIGVFGADVPLNYTDADRECRKKGAFLMSVKTEETFNLLVSLDRHADGTNIWIGCDDMITEGQFVWKEDGSIVTAENGRNLFGRGEPNNKGGREHCVCLIRARYWNFASNPDGYTDILGDWYCDWLQLYACEKSFP